MIFVKWFICIKLALRAKKFQWLPNTRQNTILKIFLIKHKKWNILADNMIRWVEYTRRMHCFLYKQRACSQRLHADGTLPAGLLLLHPLLCTLSSQGPTITKRAQTSQAGTVPSPAKARRAGTMSPDIPHWQHFTSACAALRRQTKKLIPQVTVF